MPATPGGPVAGSQGPNDLPSYVPKKFATLIKWMAGATGLPVAVVAAQVQAESDFQTSALSPTGAQGFTQIEPGTWKSSGCQGDPNDANSNAKCYVKIMYGLLQKYHGDIRKALAAYNAGPGNLQAGYGYADGILASAGESQSAIAARGSGPGGAGSQPSNPNDAATGCWWNLDFGLFSVCVIPVAAARKAVAIGLFAVAAPPLAIGILGMFGVLLQKSGALSKAADVAAFVPGGGGVAAKLVAGADAVQSPGRSAARRQGQRQREREAGQREEAELGERGASDISKARKPIRREVSEGKRPAPGPGRRTGTFTPEGRPARRETGRQRAARTARPRSTGSSSDRAPF